MGTNIHREIAPVLWQVRWVLDEESLDSKLESLWVSQIALPFEKYHQIIFPPQPIISLITNVIYLQLIACRNKKTQLENHGFFLSLFNPQMTNTFEAKTNDFWFIVEIPWHSQQTKIFNLQPLKLF